MFKFIVETATTTEPNGWVALPEVVRQNRMIIIAVWREEGSGWVRAS